MATWTTYNTKLEPKQIYVICYAMWMELVITIIYIVVTKLGKDINMHIEEKSTWFGKSNYGANL